MALKRDRKQVTNNENNPYLSNDAEGLALVSKIISSVPYGSNSNYYAVNQLIDNKLLSLSGSLNLPNELELYTRLIALSDRLMIPAKYHLLKNRSVIGLGGKFSAGKSEFINSILGRSELPTAQSPTTSVPTYIISGNNDQVLAYTGKGASINLDSHAVKAISHGFQDTYGLGLAQYLSFITISIPGFRPNLALLDTPGYNKADSNLIEAYSDSQKAYSQLRSIDYLIWLLDVHNGTLHNDDISFIKRLDLKTKILIIINKCDLKTPIDCSEVEEQARFAARNAEIPVFDVVQYSSLYPDMNHGRGRVQKFFEYAGSGDSNVEDVRAQINEIVAKISTAFQSKKKDLEEQRNLIGTAIYRSTNVMEVKALISMYGKTNSEINYIEKNYMEFQKTQQQINEMIIRL